MTGDVPGTGLRVRLLARSARLRDTPPGPGYKWVALSNTTLGVLIATMDASIVIISLPAIFRGIGLDPLAAGNIGYLLWMILGYLLVSAVLVVVLGRLGDMFGRVRIYNLGFLVFACASVALSLDPFRAGAGALWLILWRIVQAFGGSMLTANSAAILTDAFPARQRGMALGVNQITALAGQFLGLLAGGLLAAVDWRAVFWVSVPVSVTGTVWSYLSLRETSAGGRGRIDWLGNLTFASGAGILLAGITYGIQPYGGHATGWTNPWVLAGLTGGVSLLLVFCLVETRVAEPMFRVRGLRMGADDMHCGAVHIQHHIGEALVGPPVRAARVLVHVLLPVHDRPLAQHGDPAVLGCGRRVGPAGRVPAVTAASHHRCLIRVCGRRRVLQRVRGRVVERLLQHHHVVALEEGRLRYLGGPVVLPPVGVEVLAHQEDVVCQDLQRGRRFGGGRGRRAGERGSGQGEGEHGSGESAARCEGRHWISLSMKGRSGAAHQTTRDYPQVTPERARVAFGPPVSGTPCAPGGPLAFSLHEGTR